MRAVNLLPRDAQPRRSFREEDPALVVGSVLAVVVVIALGAGFMVAHSHAGAMERKLADARAQLGRLSAAQTPSKPTPSKPTTPIVPVPSVTAEQQPRLAALSSALSTRIAWDRILREFSLVVPSDISVSSLSMNAPVASSSTAASAQTFSLSGTAYSHDSVARLLARLMLVPDLDGVSLQSSTGDPETGQVTFSIDAAVKGAPAPAPAPPAAAPTTTGASS
jgi:Tfp pilus assembly protein PilN